jgi:hypothetical protein
MANSPDPHSQTLLDDYNAQLVILVQEVRGLKIIASDPNITPDELNIVNIQIGARQLRADLINASIVAINALAVDDYPDLLPVVIPPDILKAIQQEVSDVTIAAAIFASPPAETGDFNPELATITPNNPIQTAR